MWKKVLLIGFGGLVVLALGIIIGHFGTNKGKVAPGWVEELSQDVDESIIQKFINEVDTKKIEENLKELTKVPHMATTAGDEATADFVLKRWQDKISGLDKAWRDVYRVYLSFPDKTNPNKVTVVSTTNTVLHIVREREKPYTPDQENPEVVQPFAAYGPAGTVQGKLVYANHGTVSDYKLLNETIDLRGTIAIVKYGRAGRAAKAINAEPFGVVGVLVYTEPKEMNDGKVSESDTYPHSWYIPPTGVERGSYYTAFGDPLTPYLAAKNDTFRIPEGDVTGIPPIPIQPIGYEDAQILICKLNGTSAPADWQGAFPCTYNLGPGFNDTSPFNNSVVKLEVNNKNELRDSANVMGVIWGSVEPDRYVMYGNHRDSWVHGAIDPSSGTAVMMEITRVLGEMVKSGKWRPRRTIIFGSWGAEEFGLIGSAEYTEEFISKLSQRSVAYINVDISVFANATLTASASPIAQHIIFKSSQEVKIPGSNTVSVYDNWKSYSNKTSPTHGTIPNLRYMTGAGSDYAPFMHYLGVSSIDMSYTYDSSKTSARIYPAYHTAYDTFDYASKFIDPGFTSHQAVARTAGNILIRLADSLLLPFNCSDYAESLELYLKNAVDEFQTLLQSHGISLEPLKEAVKSFRSAATSLDKTIHNSALVSETPLKARRINDQLMLLDRAFVNPYAFPNKYGFRHVIWASRTSQVATFPGVADAVERKDWSEAHRQLSIVTQAISGAAHTLFEAHALL